MSANGLKPMGTLLLAFLLLAGGLVVFQAGTTQAQGKRIWGYVSDCNAPLTAPAAVTVSLVDAASQSVGDSNPAGSDGFYTFDSPDPGYYLVRFTAQNYFEEETLVFRFDGTVSVQKSLCLDPFPSAKRWYNVTVVEGALRPVVNEAPAFLNTSVSNERVDVSNGRYDPGTMTITLSEAPMVWAYAGSPSYREFVKFKNGTQLETTLVRGLHYNYLDTWTSTLTLLSANVHYALNNSLGYLNVTYRWTETTTNLVHKLIENPVTVTVNGSAFAPYWLDMDTGEFTVNSTFRFGLDVLRVNYSYAVPVSGATVEAWLGAAGGGDLVDSETTDANGVARFQLWVGTFSLQIAHGGNATLNYTLNLATHLTERRYLSDALKILVRVTTIDADPITDGLAGILYSLDANAIVKNGSRIVTGTVNSGSNTVTFRPAPGSYRMVVDADGYTAHVGDHNLAVSQVFNFVLDPSPEERVDAVLRYNNNDWNDLTIYRNLTLREDSAVPGLEQPEVRNAALQIDIGVGDGDGNLTGGELTAYQVQLENAGPRYVTTEGFFTTQSIAFLSEATSYSVAVNRVGTDLYVNTTADYVKKGSTSIKPNLLNYFLNATLEFDTNTSAYVNRTYTFVLVEGYERTTTHLPEVSGFTTVVMDSRLQPSPQTTTFPFNFVAERSENGTARAAVTGPENRFFVTNGSEDGYAAAVAGGFDIVFSANATTVGAGDPRDANYTWAWGDTTTGYGQWTTHNFTGAAARTVVLTVRQPNAQNTTAFTLRLTVDTQKPTAVIQNNVTGAVNESEFIRFTAAASTDATGITGTPGRIVEWHWDFNADGIEDPPGGENVTHAFDDPGTFNATLWVVDWVGHSTYGATNVTLVQQVLDVTPPTVGEWTISRVTPWVPTATEVKEDVRYAFNASSGTADNLDTDAQLNYTWKFSDATTNTTKYGENATYQWTEPGNYKVNLTVKDRAGKVAYREVTQTVIVDDKVHSNLQVISITADPNSLEEGATTTITVTFKHIQGDAADPVVTVTAVRVQGTAATSFEITPSFYDAAGNAAGANISKGETKSVKFTYTVDSEVGSRTIKVTVKGSLEPSLRVGAENSQTVTITVKPAGWKGVVPWLLLGLVVIGIPVGIYVYRKITSGEWELRRRKKEEEDEEEDEGKPRKKRL